MSSPYIRHSEDYPDRRVASSPPPTALGLPEPREPSIRPMRLKVLYTFDSENKTNCLARWPQILNIRTAYLDETTQIGVIELKTCIQAIVAASPELTAKLGQDYTVYAYDYSEYETPLVGQGMLSWVLASSSVTSSAALHRPITVVTGRVCKNVLELFGNGLQETLEVKLRLVPVPTCLQSEYIESMRKYRDLSRVIPQTFDPQSWTDFLKANPAILSLTNQSRSQSPVNTSDHSLQGLERVQQLVKEGYGTQSMAVRSSSQRRNSGATTILSGQETFHMGSPTPSVQSMATIQAAQHGLHCRTASRASNKDSDAPIRHGSAGPTIDTEYTSNDERHEEGPPKKRAKTVKADHPGKEALGKKADSLRVTASAAASIRVFQPTATKPGNFSIHPLEGPPRVPTPIPKSPSQTERRLIPATKSNLSESFLTSDSGYKSLYTGSDPTSPEKRRTHNSSVESPEAPGSSPPLVRETSAAPSSPVLPALPRPRPLDSIECGICDLEDEEEMNGQIDDSLLRRESIVGQVDQFVSEHFSDLQHEVSQKQALEEAKQRELSMRNARKAIGLKRSQTWAGEQPSSEAAQPLKRRNLQARSSEPKSRSGWDKEKRKRAIQSKLNSSLEAGEMPPFCENCGAIETPTWRKAYSRLHSGDHSQVAVSNEEGGIVAVQVVETNEDGSTKTFKIFKKSRSGEEEQEGFTEVLLCNPCGIWLSNRNRMRPPNLWAKEKIKSDSTKEKPRRSRAKKKTEQVNDRSDFPNAPSETVASTSETSMAVTKLNERGFQQAEKGLDAAVNNATSKDVIIHNLKRSGLVETELASTEDANKSGVSIDPSAIAALQHAIRSSPGQDRFLGSKTSPIELDKIGSDPARRTLFPSPKTGGPLGVSASDKFNGTGKPPRTPNESRRNITRLDKRDQADKENMPPSPSTPDDGLDELFSGFSPLTQSRSINNESTNGSFVFFKTPLPKSVSGNKSITTGDCFSSTAKAFLHQPRTPSRTPTKQGSQVISDLTPFTMHLNQLLSENPNTSPSQLLSELDTLPVLNLEQEIARPDLADGGTPSRIFRTTDFDLVAFESSDLPVPSSPPAWFTVYDNPNEDVNSWKLDVGVDIANSAKVETPEKQNTGFGQKSINV